MLQPVFRVKTMLVAGLLLMCSEAVFAEGADTLTYSTCRPVCVLKTNMLYDAALVPNIGLEVNLGKQWTLGLDGFFTWISCDHRHRYWQGYGGYLTLRRYLGRAQSFNTQYSALSGHHVGVYGLGLTYDVEFGGRGYQAAKFGFGGGVEYGYALPIGRQLQIDFAIGLGFQDGEYKEYLPTDDGTGHGHYVWQVTRKRHWYGPTKAEVSFRWLLGRKGGGR